MTRRQRNALLLLALAVLIALAWLTRARWLPGVLAGLTTNAELIQTIENLASIAGVLIPGLIALLALFGLIRRPAPAEPLSLLQAVTVEELRRGLGRDGSISWIPRGATHPDALMSRRRLVITGVAKAGKTREAIELIQAALKLERCLAPYEIARFTPSPPRGSTSWKTSIKGGCRSRTSIRSPWPGWMSPRWRGWLTPLPDSTTSRPMRRRVER
jgi:hypothetical protein